MLDTVLAMPPGRLYVVAALLPLAAFAVLLAGTLRALCRPYRDEAAFGAKLFRALGGDTPQRTGAYLVLASMAGSAFLGIYGLYHFVQDGSLTAEARNARWTERMDWVRIGPLASAPPAEFERQRRENQNPPVPRTGLALELGYRIDSLTAVLFAMVAVVGTAIVVFSLGYMSGETEPVVEDHEVDRQLHARRPVPLGGGHDTTPPTFADESQPPVAEAHFHRRGRFGQFFLYLALFCFSMFNLLIADNLFQVFVSWELVGVCSFFLIGFYYERPSASTAANKAFIMNRIGDAGFLIGLLIAWTSLGTLDFEEMGRRVRAPRQNDKTPYDLEGKFVRVDAVAKANGAAANYELSHSSNGAYLALFPLVWPNADTSSSIGHEKGRDSALDAPRKATFTDYAVMPYWLFVVMGLGLFLGCVGKSAQLPLHTWLPDAMEGPTPVSALIHAATMVAAGVYLVGRAYPLFAPEVLLVVAYTGAITLFVAATIALVQTDIKRVLAYSTVSQLGYMMLALGVGGWVAGLLHLVTHAFFKALLFLGAGSVIHGCHHEQDLRAMGGLRRKMPVTAYTMLVGVLAIVGTPLFSGWYSKDQIMHAALTFGLSQPQHLILFVLPLVTAGLTAFYMFRLWFLAFTGAPRDQGVFDLARESPPVMTRPLLVLAAFSLGVAWGWPVWEPNASLLGLTLQGAEPRFVSEAGLGERWRGDSWHGLVVGVLAFVAAAAGAGIAASLYWKPRRGLFPLNRKEHGLRNFLTRKWYFDELYAFLFTRPTLRLARVAGAFDKRPTDAQATHEPGDELPPPRRFDWRTLDGLLNALGEATDAVGRGLRGAQTGQLRSYVLVLALTATVLLAILTSLSRS